jgi:DNA-binding NtrC family response regulator
MTKHEILLIEDSEEDAILVRRTIDKHLPGQFDVTHMATLLDAENYIKTHKDDISLILLDLGLPDAFSSRDAFEHMKAHASKIPIVVLTGNEDHALALSLIREGAEDFVNKGLIHAKPESLRDTVEFAACRHQLVGDTHRKHQELMREKDEVISWMGGDYSKR